MVCRACGGTSFDAAGACRTCGVVAHNHADTAPRSAVQPVPRAAAVPEPTPAPALRGSRPLRTDDPASTNPGSGVFCGRCGSTVDVRNDFCGICGNPLNDAALGRMRRARGNSRGLAAPPPSRAPDAPRVPTPTAQTNPSSSRGSVKHTGFPWPRLLILLVVVAMLVAAYWALPLITHHR